MRITLVQTNKNSYNSFAIKIRLKYLKLAENETKQNVKEKMKN